MILSDHTIKKRMQSGNLIIHPFEDKLLQPASIDIRLGTDFMTYLSGATNPLIDPASTLVDGVLHYERVVCNKMHPDFFVYPQQFVLAASLETIKMPDDLIGIVYGKSSLSRLGLMVQISHEHIDPGFEGHITFELMSMANRPIRLVPGMTIAQILFEELDHPADRKYGDPALNSKYQGQRGVTGPIFRLPTDRQD